MQASGGVQVVSRSLIGQIPFGSRVWCDTSAVLVLVLLSIDKLRRHEIQEMTQTIHGAKLINTATCGGVESSYMRVQGRSRKNSPNSCFAVMRHSRAVIGRVWH